MRVWGTGLVKGLGITIRNMFRTPITVQYPRERLVLPERSRWTVAATYDENNDIKCTACMSCVRACPDHVLDLQLTVGEDKSKHIDHFRYESAACMMCGLCVEACPFDAIHQTHDYELANTSIAALTYDLLSDVDAASPRRKAAVDAPKKQAPPNDAQINADAPVDSSVEASTPPQDAEPKEANDA